MIKQIGISSILTLIFAFSLVLPAAAQTQNEIQAEQYAKQIYDACRQAGGSAANCTTRQNRAELAMKRFLDCMDSQSSDGHQPLCGVDPSIYGSPNYRTGYPYGTAAAGSLQNNGQNTATTSLAQQPRTAWGADWVPRGAGRWDWQPANGVKG